MTAGADTVTVCFLVSPYSMEELYNLASTSDKVGSSRVCQQQLQSVEGSPSYK